MGVLSLEYFEGGMGNQSFFGNLCDIFTHRDLIGDRYMNKHLNETMNELKSKFSKLYKDRLEDMYLFGSQARGSSDVGSDIDVMVVLHGNVDPNEERIRTLEIVSDLSLEKDVVISCLFAESQTYLNKKGPLYRNIRREGIAL